MQRYIRKATLADLFAVKTLIESGRRIMKATGNPHQWNDNRPAEWQLRDDIEHQHSYLLVDHGQAVATWALIPGPDVTYRTIYHGHWLDDTQPYYVIHRVASLPDAHGVMHDLLDYCLKLTSNIRIDTHRDNHIMQHCLSKAGFTYCGIILLLDGDERLAYQKITASRPAL